jgi:Fe-S-cluster containining protein
MEIRTMSEKHNETVSGLIDDIGGFYKRIDDKLGSSLEKDAIENDRKVSCPNCTTPHCCYQKVIVGFWEILPAARHLHGKGMSSDGFVAGLADIGERMEAASSPAWFDVRTPCIFLQNGRCDIYPYRPIECRSQFVISPPEDCGKPNGKLVAIVDDKPVLEVAFKFGLDIHKVLRLRETDMRVYMGTMPRLLALALEVFRSNDDHRKFLRNQTWPSKRQIEEGWFDGKNLFSERVSAV